MTVPVSQTPGTGRDERPRWSVADVGLAVVDGGDAGHVVQGTVTRQGVAYARDDVVHRVVDVPVPRQRIRVEGGLEAADGRGAPPDPGGPGAPPESGEAGPSLPAVPFPVPDTSPREVARHPAGVPQPRMKSAVPAAGRAENVRLSLLRSPLSVCRARMSVCCASATLTRAASAASPVRPLIWSLSCADVALGCAARSRDTSPRSFSQMLSTETCASSSVPATPRKVTAAVLSACCAPWAAAPNRPMKAVKAVAGAPCQSCVTSATAALTVPACPTQSPTASDQPVAVARAAAGFTSTCAT